MVVKERQLGRCAEWIKNLALMGVSACVVFLAVELLIRYKIKAWPFEIPLHTPAYLSAREAPLRWRFSAGDDRNSLGLRNREVGDKQPNTLRILFVGDSLIWSSETSSGELYTQVLEQRLNAHSTRKSRFEVINAGIPGYTTYQELEFIKIYGLDIKPDLVVLGFVFNDLYYKYFHRPNDKALLGFEPAAHLYHFDTDSYAGMLLGRSHLAHEVVRRSDILWKKMIGKPVFPFERRGDVFLAWKHYGWNRSRRLIGEIDTLLREKKVKLHVLVFPIRDQVNPEYRKIDEAYVLYPQRQIREICNEYGIPMLDLTDTVYKHGGVTLFQDHLHLNSKGNDVIAVALERYLTKRFGLTS